MSSPVVRCIRLLLLAVAWLAVACQSLEDPIVCGQIPDGGCPAGRGGTCDDALCAALYDCAEGTWVVVEECPDDGSGGAGGRGAGGAGGGTGGMACTPVELDHEGESIGCSPDLQHPDCPAAAAETCAETACLSDCADFFMCIDSARDDKQWTIVAHCDARGQLVVGGR
jgi:hypothetical protein